MDVQTFNCFWIQHERLSININKCVIHSCSHNHLKKYWDDLMAVLEFDPLSPLCNVNKCHVVNFTVVPLNIVWWAQKGYGLKKGSSYMHIIV